MDSGFALRTVSVAGLLWRRGLLGLQWLVAGPRRGGGDRQLCGGGQGGGQIHGRRCRGQRLRRGVRVGLCGARGDFDPAGLGRPQGGEHGGRTHGDDASPRGGVEDGRPRRGGAVAGGAAWIQLRLEGEGERGSEREKGI